MSKVLIEKSVHGPLSINVFLFSATEELINFFGLLDVWGCKRGVDGYDGCRKFEVLSEATSMFTSDNFQNLCRRNNIELEVRL